MKNSPRNENPLAPFISKENHRFNHWLSELNLFHKYFTILKNIFFKFQIHNISGKILHMYLQMFQFETWECSYHCLGFSHETSQRRIRKIETIHIIPHINDDPGRIHVCEKDDRHVYWSRSKKEEQYPGDILYRIIFLFEQL